MLPIFSFNTVSLSFSFFVLYILYVFYYLYLYMYLCFVDFDRNIFLIFECSAKQLECAD